jgi:ABC-type taurine transport system substrate-binding protein
VSGAAAILTARTVASGAVAPYKLEVNKIDVYGTRDPQLMAMPSLAEVSGHFKDEGLTVERHFVASAGELPNMLASGNISIGCGGVTTLLILGGQGVPVYRVLQQADISGTQALVLGRRLANTTDPKALNGIKVGPTQGNSPIEVWTGLATELGVDRSSVKILQPQAARARRRARQGRHRRHGVVPAVHLPGHAGRREAHRHRQPLVLARPGGPVPGG